MTSKIMEDDLTKMENDQKEMEDGLKQKYKNGRRSQAQFKKSTFKAVT